MKSTLRSIFFWVQLLIKSGNHNYIFLCQCWLIQMRNYDWQHIITQHDLDVLISEEFLLPFKGIAVGALLGVIFLLLEFIIFSSERMEVRVNVCFIIMSYFFSTYSINNICIWDCRYFAWENSYKDGVFNLVTFNHFT